MDPTLMNAEWEAWQSWHEEFKILTGMNINDSKCNRFASLTRIWGERLVKLRESQSPQMHSGNVIAEEVAKLCSTRATGLLIA